MTTPRVRVIGGPNGSGKSTLLSLLMSQGIPLGHVQNPDAIEATLRMDRRLDLRPFGVDCDQASFDAFRAAHPLHAQTIGLQASIVNSVLEISGEYPGYFTPLLCDFMRNEWLRTGQSFTFETVMSGSDKIAFLQSARVRGYRVYLYYVCTNSPQISFERVTARVAQGGHDVPPAKVEHRYHASLRAVSAVLPATARAYFFDNSTDQHRLVAEFEEARLKTVVTDPPPWCVNYVLTPKGP